jgi:hypothetical protein
MNRLDTNIYSLGERASRGEPVASVELRRQLETRLRPVVRRALRLRDDAELSQRILAAARRRTAGDLPADADRRPGLIDQVARDLAALLALGLHRRPAQLPAPRRLASA